MRFTRIFHNTDDKILCSKLLSEDFNGAISDRFDMAFSDFSDFYFVTQAVKGYFRVGAITIDGFSSIMKFSS